MRANRFLVKTCSGICLLAASAWSFATIDPPYESTLDTGKQLLEQAEYSAAAKVLDKATKAIRKSQGDYTLDDIELLLAAARAHAGQGKLRRSNGYFESVFKVLAESADQEISDVVFRVFSSRKDANFEWRSTTRIKQLEKVYDIATKKLGPMDLRLASMAREIGMIKFYFGDRKDALAYLDMAYDFVMNYSFTDPDQIGTELVKLGAGYFRLGQSDTGDGLLGIAMSIGATTEDATAWQRVAPVYPDECLSGVISGEVHILFSVDDKGKVHEPLVTKAKIWNERKNEAAVDESCEKGLIAAATATVLTFAYVPKLENGVLVASSGVGTAIFFDIEEIE